MAIVPGTSLANYGLNFARIAAASDGDNKVVAGTTGKSIVVLGYTINANAAGVVAFQDSATEAAIAASLELTDGETVVYAGGPHCPAFMIAEGLDLEVNCAAGVDALGHLVYILI